MTSLTAVYDLSRAPPTYDFLTFFLQAEMERVRGGYNKLYIEIPPGPKEGFRNDRLPPGPETRRLMLEKVVRASLPLLGAEEGSEGKRITHLRYLAHRIVEAARAGEEVPKFRPTQAAWERMARYQGAVILSLRECHYHPERNSCLDSWVAFAEEIRRQGKRPVFVRDTAKAREPIGGFETCPEASEDIDLRCALYQRASIVYAVNGGPCMLLYYSDTPYRVFKQLVQGNGATRPEYWTRAIGISRGEQWPWAHEDQKLMWMDDKREALLSVL